MVELTDERQYEALMERIEELLKFVSDETPRYDKNMVELEFLSLLVEEYEQKYYAIKPPTLKEILLDRMDDLRISQKELADMIGVSAPRISEYLSGKSEPTLKIARIMCRKLDIDPEVFIHP